VQRFDVRRYLFEVVFSPSGQYAISSSADGKVHLWEVGRDQKIREFPHAESLEEDINLYLGVMFEDTDYAKIKDAFYKAKTESEFERAFDMDSAYWGEAQERLQALNFVSCVQFTDFSPDGRRILSANEYGYVCLWDVKTGNRISYCQANNFNFPSDCYPVLRASFLRDGRPLYCAGGDGSIDLTEVGREIRVSGSLDNYHVLTVVTISPDGQFVLCGSAVGAIELWDVARRQTRLAFDQQGAAVTSLAFSPNLQRALSGGKDGIARLWDIEKGQEICRLEGHEGPVQHVAFSPGGLHAATCGEDKTVRLWRLPE